MKDETTNEMISAYVLGALEGPEAQEVEQHLRESSDGATALGEHARNAALLGASVQPVRPPAHIKDALLKRVAPNGAGSADAGITAAPTPEPREGESPRELAARVANRPWYSGPMGAVAAIALTTIGMLFYFLTQIRSDLDTLKRVSIARDMNLAKIRERLEQRDRFILALYSQDARVASVSGKQVAAKANGSFVYLPHRRSAQFFISGLDKPPPGKSYQLWLIVDKKAVDGGLIAPANDGVTMAEVPVNAEPGKVNAFAVSLEPSGGVPVRTGPIIIVAPITK